MAECINLFVCWGVGGDWVIGVRDLINVNNDKIVLVVSEIFLSLVRNKKKMMNKCLNCEKEIVSIEGRRAKKYCDNKGKCKGEYFRKQKKPSQYVNRATFDELESRYNQLINAARGRDKNGVNNDELNIKVVEDIVADFEYWEQHKNDNPEKAKFDAVYNKEILSKIAAIKSEKIPSERNTQLGRKSWDNDQRKRISELQSKLK